MQTESAGSWAQIDELFGRAARLPPADRRAFLDAEATSEPVRREVERLLAAHERADGFLDRLDPVLASALVHAAWDEVRAGDLLGPYRVVRPLGRGGMGTVLLGHDPRLDRLVALKLLPAGRAAAASANRRLIEEARAASALDHPHIATIHEIGETADGRRYIAMAYYEGETLRQRIARGPLPAGELLELACQIAEGLRAAHSRGIIHRDVKPENVVVTTDGAVKIVDFGVAQVTRVPQDADDSADRGGGVEPGGGSEWTHAAAMGTVAYMSPEQTRGGRVDARTDLWSLGVLLHEMLTGERPFRGASDEELVAAIRAAQLPATRSGDPLRAGLEHVIERCLRQDATDRFPSAGALLSELRRLRYAADAALPTPALSPLPRSPRRRLVAGGGVLLVLLSMLGLWQVGPGKGAPADMSSIAVLPFANLSGSAADDYLSDGVAEELISTLAREPGLHVAARTSSFQFRNAAAGNARHIGQTLGVRHLLEGSVQRAGDRVRVNARLVDATNGYHVWSESYESPAAGLLAVEDEISRAVVAALRERLGSPAVQAAPRARTRSAEAHDLYLRGRYAWGKRTKPEFERAIQYFQAALQADPHHAGAHAGLADAYAMLGTYGLIPGVDAFPRARAAAERALELDPTLADAHASLGMALVTGRDFAAAERALRRAIELSPSNATARHWYGFTLATLDRVNEALQELRRARELDPLSLPVHSSLGRVLVQAGQHDLAAAEVRRAMDLDPNFAWTWHTLGTAYVAQGRYAEATAAFERTRERAPDNPGMDATIAAVQARAGHPAAARALLARFERGAAADLDEYYATLLYAAMGDVDAAFAQLMSVPWNSEFMFKLRADPLLDPLRQDPRYGALLRDLGMSR